ncbi:MAG: helix-turn-helix domain-containing protein [Hyphomonadaceae bacterium]
MMKGFWKERTRDEACARLSAELAAFALGVAPDDIATPARGDARAVRARQAAMYLCHVAFEMSLGRVALAFGRDRSTVAHACHIIEDLRDDRAFDAWIAAMEAALRQAPPPPIPAEGAA